MKWLFSLVVMAAIACKPPIQQNQSFQFNCDSLIDLQVKLLTDESAGMKKLTSVGELIDTVTLAKGQIDWNIELKPFRVLSLINKPVHRSDYDIFTTPDSMSNLTIKSWVAKRDVPVREVRLYYLGRPNQIKKLEARIEEANFVFSTSKDIQMEFGLLTEPTKLERFKIWGGQKFLLGKATNFLVEGAIQPK